MNDIDDLIGKVLAGEATPEEQRQLQVWSDLSAANRKYVNQIRIIFNSKHSLHFDAETAWKIVKEKLKKEGNNQEAMASPARFWPLLKIAAGIIMIMFIGIFSYRWWIQPAQTFEAASGSSVLRDTLPDGSIAFLNKGTSVSYGYNRRQKVRIIKLQGEVFFEVKHEAEKPFIVEAADVFVRDIGTAFNVKAYPESDTVEVVVKAGEVQIYTSENAGLHLTPGQTGIYSKRLAEFTRLEKADTNVLAYKTGVFSFNNTDLKTVIEKINEVYDARIRLQNPALSSCRLTVNFQGEPLDTIVEIIAETLKLTVTRKGKEILLEGSACK